MKRRASSHPTDVDPILLEDQNMSTAIKVEIFSICAAFAFMTGVLAAVW